MFRYDCPDDHSIDDDLAAFVDEAAGSGKEAAPT
jgi:hypothetical protein